MAGVLVPVVMMRRFTTLVGVGSFSTVAIEVKDYEKAILSAWRGPVLFGATASFNVEESTDQKDWTLCSGASADWDPGEDTEGQVTATLTKRWLRVRAAQAGPSPRVSCWVLGFLERREP